LVLAMDCGANVNVLHEYEHFSAFYFMVEIECIHIQMSF
jgi:hypothetical protein